MGNAKGKLTVAQVAEQVHGQGQVLAEVQSTLGELLSAIKGGQVGAAPAPEAPAQRRRVGAKAQARSDWRAAVIEAALRDGKNGPSKFSSEATVHVIGSADDEHVLVYQHQQTEAGTERVRWGHSRRNADGSYSRPTPTKSDYPSNILALAEALAK